MADDIDDHPGVNEGRTLRIIVLECIGVVMLALGFVGIFLPILPTTPFVLAAAFCFSANPVMYERIRNSRYFGEYIRAYREGTGISMGTHIVGIVIVWAVMAVSIVFLIHEDWIRILLVAIGVVITIHLLTITRVRSV